MWKILVPGAALIIFGLWFVSKPSARSASVELPAEARECPLRVIKEGDSFGEVKAASGSRMHFKGKRDGADMYVVEDGDDCHAFLTFKWSGSENALDRVVIVKRPAPMSDAARHPEMARLREDAFVQAYVLANYGQDELTQSELEQLAHDEYKMGAETSSSGYFEPQLFMSNRSERAFDLLVKLQHPAGNPRP